MGISQAELANFRAKLDQDAADDYVRPPTAPVVAVPPSQVAPPPVEAGLGDRIDGSGGRLVANPAVRSFFLPAASGISVAGGLGERLGSAGMGALGYNAARDATSFNRDQPPAPTQLAPMAPLDLTVPTSPTLAQMRGPTSASGGYGAGGPGGGAGLAAAYKQMQANQLGTINEQKDIVERGGELHAERIGKTADLEELAAARKQRDAEVMAEHQEKVGAQHDAFLQRNQQLADQIGAEKIDPSRVIGDKSVGEKISLLIAGILSGANGQGPQFLGRLDSMIDQGVKAQMANADNAKAKLSARQSVFGQMMAETGDRRVAEMQTKNLMYEAVKQKLSSDAERLGIPEVQNNAALAVNTLTETKSNPLQTQMAADALKAFQQQAAANASLQRQNEDRAWNRGMQVAELGLKKDQAQLERDKFDAENGAGQPGGLDKAGRNAMALEQAKAQKELDALNRSISAANPADVSRGGEVGRVAAEHLPAWVPGVTGARENANARDEYNSLVRPGVGAAWKLRTGGVEPKNPTILEEQAKPFLIRPDDNEEVVKDKMARFRKHLDQSADSAGAKPAAPPASLHFDGTPATPGTQTADDLRRALENSAGRK